VLLKQIRIIEKGKLETKTKYKTFLLKQLCHEAKVTLKKMPARTVANTVFVLHSLKAVDKQLLAKLAPNMLARYVSTASVHCVWCSVPACWCTFSCCFHPVVALGLAVWSLKCKDAGARSENVLGLIV
jgi:hypothetical protein